MTSDRTEILSSRNETQLPVDLNLVRTKCFLGGEYVDDDRAARYVLEAIEQFELETQQILLQSTARARFPAERFPSFSRIYRSARLTLPGFGTALTALTQGGTDILASAVQTKRRDWDGIDLELPDGWSGAEVVAEFTAGIPPDGELPANVVGALCEAIKSDYLQSPDAMTLFYSRIQRYQLW